MELLAQPGQALGEPCWICDDLSVPVGPGLGFVACILADLIVTDTLEAEGDQEVGLLEKELAGDTVVGV